MPTPSCLLYHSVIFSFCRIKFAAISDMHSNNNTTGTSTQYRKKEENVNEYATVGPMYTTPMQKMTSSICTSIENSSFLSNRSFLCRTKFLDPPFQGYGTGLHEETINTSSRLKYMLSPLNSTKDTSIENQLDELRSILLDNQELLESHIDNLSSCSKQLQSQQSQQQNINSQFEVIETQLSEFLETLQRKKDRKTSLHPNSDKKELNNFILHGKNLIDSLNDGIIKQELVRNIEEVIGTF